MPPKSRRMSLRFVFRGVSCYLCKHHRPLPAFPKSGNRHPAPKSCASPTQSETGYLLLPLGRNLIHSRPNPVIAPIPTLSHFFIMAKLERLVIHCTATPPGREVSAADIRRWHTAPVSQGGRGWRQVGYTDLIHLDGSVERLVPNNEDRTVDPWEITNGACGYNATTSRHIAYAGGVAADGTTPCDTRTPQQKSAPRTLRPGFRRPISRRSRRRA